MVTSVDRPGRQGGAGRAPCPAVYPQRDEKVVRVGDVDLGHDAVGDPARIVDAVLANARRPAAPGVRT